MSNENSNQESNQQFNCCTPRTNQQQNQGAKESIIEYAPKQKCNPKGC